MRTKIEETNYMALPGLKPGNYFVGNTINIQDIVNCVGEEFLVTEQEMKSIHRYRRIVEARMSAIYLIKKHTKLSLFEIGKKFGGRDHTTAIHSIKRIQDLIDTEPEFKQRLLQIENRLL